MLMKTRIWTIALAASIALTACTGAKLNTFDDDFERLYSAKVESNRNGDDTSAVAADFGLLDLSKRAKAAGDGETTKDWKTAVAFYRIAALSAWQVGEDGEAQILPITNAGQKLCKGRMAEAPRDCILMMIIGPLAIHDDLARDLVPIQTRADTDPSVELSAENLGTLVKVFDGVKIQFDKLTEVKISAATSSAPSSLGRYIDDQRLLFYCTAKAARDIMNLAPPPEGFQAQQEKKNDVMNMKTQIVEAKGHAECPSA
jgi:hypothetical protein